MARPFFSILTTAYNAEEFVGETIATMFAQSFQDWEWIILNDGSTDRTWEIVTRLTAGHPRVRLLENPRNLGLRAALNRLLGEATGEWLGYLHADDGYRAHTLKTIHDYTRDRADLVMWALSRLAVGAGHVPDVIDLYQHVTEFRSEDFADLLYLRGCLFGGMSNHFFRRPDPALGLSFVDGTHSVDLRFWLRYLKAHPGRRAVYHPDVLAYMTKHPEAMSLQMARTGEWVADFFTIPRDVANLGWSTRMRLLQIARTFQCWLQFFPRISPADRWVPLQTIAAIVRSFFPR